MKIKLQGLWRDIAGVKEMLPLVNMSLQAPHAWPRPIYSLQLSTQPFCELLLLMQAWTESLYLYKNGP